jgi:hypothetical protein
MKLHRLFAAVCLVVSAAWAPASQTLVAASTSPEERSIVEHEGSRGSWKDALVGTWDLVITFSDQSQVKSVLTVIPGRTEGEGSVLHAAEASLLLPNPTTTEQGAWAHLGHRLFVESHFGFAVDGSFTVPAGRIGFRQHQITVHPSGETFRGTATFEVRDPAGVVVFSDQIQSVGRRQRP